MSFDYVTTVYGPMPATLQSASLGDLCEPGGVQTGPFGSQLHQEDYVEEGTPIITVEHLGENRIVHENLPRVSEVDRIRLTKYSLKAGDIVFSRVGSVDRRAMVQLAEDGWLFSGRCLRVRPKKTLLDSRWLSYFFGLPAFKSYIRGIAVGATMPSLNTKILSDVPIFFPPLPVQRQAANLCTLIDDRIALLRETNVTLEAIAQALFKSWFVDFDPVRAKMEGRAPEGMDEATARLFPDSIEKSELGLVPRGWRVAKIGEVCTLGRGSSPRPIQDFMGDDIPWIKIADATASDGMFVFKTKEKIKREGASKSTAVAHGDLIMSNSASCGIPVFVELEGCIHDGWLYFKNFSGVSKILMFYWLRHISDHLVNIADGSVQKNLNIGLVSSQSIICPVDPLLNAFDALCQSLLDRVRENCLQAQTLATLRDALLPRLISGQLRLPEAMAETKAAL